MTKQHADLALQFIVDDNIVSIDAQVGIRLFAKWLDERPADEPREAQFPKPGDPPFDAAEVAKHSAGPMRCLACGQPMTGVSPDIATLAHRCIELHDELGGGFYDIDEWREAEEALRNALNRQADQMCKHDDGQCHENDPCEDCPAVNREEKP
jgi:hypothetical protein